MSPSSLIFVVIIVVWAVYLTLHVIRRREHLATARNVDRFSAHMRVLQRRAVKNAPRTRLKSSVNLVRGGMERTGGPVAGEGATEPEAIGKLDQSTPHSTRSGASAAAVSGESISAAVRRPTVPGGRKRPSTQPQSVRTQAVPAAQVEPEIAPDSSRRAGSVGTHLTDSKGVADGQAEATAQPAPIRITWPFAILGGLLTLPAKYLRSAALALSGLVVVAMLLLAVVGMVPLSAVGLSALPLACVLAWLPRSAQAERDARSRQVLARRQARVGVVSTSPVDPVNKPAPCEPAERRQGRPETRREPLRQEPRRSRKSVEARSMRAGVEGSQQQAKSVADGSPATAHDRVRESAPPAARTPQRPRRSEPFDLLTDDPTWSPVPVPPPTYTLKAKAHHPQPPPVAHEVPVPIDVDDDFDDWASSRTYPTARKEAVNG